MKTKGHIQLEEYLKNTKTTQRQLARAMGVHYKTLNAIVKQYRRPTVDQVNQLTIHCDISQFAWDRNDKQ